MESSRRDLLIDMAEHSSILKNNRSTVNSRFSFVLKTGITSPKTGVLFLLWTHFITFTWRRDSIYCNLCLSEKIYTGELPIVSENRQRLWWTVESWVGSWCPFGGYATGSHPAAHVYWMCLLSNEQRAELTDFYTVVDRVMFLGSSEVGPMGGVPPPRGETLLGAVIVVREHILWDSPACLDTPRVAICMGITPTVSGNKLCA